MLRSTHRKTESSRGRVGTHRSTNASGTRKSGTVPRHLILKNFMKLKFWGVRGSIPVPGPGTVKYGGNTTCLEIKGSQGECIVLDSGSGVRTLGLDLLKRKPIPPINLFITHTHWDHIQGFPFFTPCYIPGTTIHVKGPVHFVETKT